MMMKTVLLVFATLLCVTSTLAITKNLLQAVTIRENQNLNAEPLLRVGKDSPQDDPQRALLLFQDIPSPCTVTLATMYLYLDSFHTSGPRTLIVSQVMEQWSETQETAPGPAVANPTGGVTVPDTSQSSIAFDITPIAKNWAMANGAPNYGVMVQATGEDSIIGQSPRFISNDANCGTNCPYLEVDYTCP